MGLAVDAGIVTGGGYLYFDFDRGEYAGVLELSIAEVVSVKAIGLITTRMPDGSKGFSLLIIITAYAGDNDRKKSYEAHFDHHFTKPLDYRVITEMLA